MNIEAVLIWFICTAIGTIILSAIIIAYESFFPPKTYQLYLPKERLSDEDMFFPKMNYSDNHKKRSL